MAHGGHYIYKHNTTLYGNAVIGTNIQMYDSKTVLCMLLLKKVVVQGLDGYICNRKRWNVAYLQTFCEEQRIKQFSENNWIQD